MAIIPGQAGRAEDFTGMIMLYGGQSAPDGFLLCNGAEVSRETYSTLFSILGTSYGEGDGSTTFNIPDLRSRVPVGVDASENDFEDLGNQGGEKEHTLTVAEMPSHNHATDRDGGGAAAGGGSSARALTSGVTGNTGGGEAHNNMQPYVTVNYIIKT